MGESLVRCWLCGDSFPLDGNGNIFQHWLHDHDGSTVSRDVTDILFLELVAPLEEARQ